MKLVKESIEQPEALAAVSSIAMSKTRFAMMRESAVSKDPCEDQAVRNSLSLEVNLVVNIESREVSEVKINSFEVSGIEGKTE